MTVDSAVQVIYSDLDATMVGPGGCFFRAEDRSVTVQPAGALAELLAAGVSLVLVSGRSQTQLLEACAIFGADGYVAELGAFVGWDRGRQARLLRGAMPAQLDAIPQDVVDALLARYADRLELHAPWHAGHVMDVMLRGQVDAAEVDAWLAAQGVGWLRMHDNGLLAPGHAGIPVAELHIYHLVAAGIDKGRAVGYDLERRGLSPAQAIAIGDSASDLAMARYVGRFHLVANGAKSAPVRALARAAGNVVIESEALGLGWASAVRAALARAGG